MHGSFKHLLHLLPLLHLYSISQSWDFSPGFPQRTPNSLVSSPISLQLTPYLLLTSLFQTLLFTWLSLAQSLRHFKFLWEHFSGTPQAVPLVIWSTMIPRQESTIPHDDFCLFYLCSLDCGEFPHVLRLNTKFVERTHARSKFCLPCHI